MSFDNRELALITWSVFVLFIVILNKNTRGSVKKIIETILYKQFVVFYLLSTGILILGIWFLFILGLWNYDMLKDTVKWFLFFQIPMAFNSIDKAEDKDFFLISIKKFIKIATVISFVMNFWTFSFWTEFLLLPSILLILMLKYKKIKIADYILNFLGTCAIIFAIVHLYNNYDDFLKIQTLKLIILPFLLTLLNLPVPYALVLYAKYELIFLRINRNSVEIKKLKWHIFKFAKFNLRNVFSVERYSAQTNFISCTNDKEMRQCLKQIKTLMKNRIAEFYTAKIDQYIEGMFFSMIVYIAGILGIYVYYGFRFLIPITQVNYSFITVYIIVNVILFFCRRKREKRLFILKQNILGDFVKTIQCYNNILDRSDRFYLKPLDTFENILTPTCIMYNICENILNRRMRILKYVEEDALNKMLFSIESLGKLPNNTKSLEKIDVDDVIKFYRNESNKIYLQTEITRCQKNIEEGYKIFNKYKI